MKLSTKVTSWLVESPVVKTLAFVLFSLSAGVLSGALVADLTTPLGIEWARCLHVWPFYAIILLALLQYAYQRLLIASEHATEKFMDIKWVRAYMLRQCLAEAAGQYRDMIRNGEVGELERAMAEVERVLGIGKRR